MASKMQVKPSTQTPNSEPVRRYVSVGQGRSCGPDAQEAKEGPYGGPMMAPVLRTSQGNEERPDGYRVSGRFSHDA